MVNIAGINLTEHKPHLKMGGFLSINVSVKMNPFCVSMAKGDIICKQCYANYMEKRYPRLKHTLEDNYNNLSKGYLTVEQIEEIADYVIKNSIGLRFNSMGELINENHAMNLILIAKKIRSIKPNFPIALWSKRVDMIQKYFARGEYMNLIYSNPLIDDVVDYPPKGFDGIFNVITYDYAKKNQLKPSCAGYCRDCMACYKPAKKEVFRVIELLKRDQMRIKRFKLEEL